jgi:hypothetical protein
MSSEEAKEVKSATVQQSLAKIAELGGVSARDIEPLFEKHRARAKRSADSGRAAWIRRIESVRTPATTHLVDAAIKHMDAGEVEAVIRIAEQLRAQLMSQPSNSCASCSSTGGTGHQ